MKKSLLLLATILMLVACKKNGEETEELLYSKIETITYEDLGIVVQGDKVISPSWIEEKRLEACSNDPRGVWAVWVYTVQWKGETYISFWNALLSYVGPIKLYDINGKLVVDEVNGAEIQNVTRICPIIKD